MKSHVKRCKCLVKDYDDTDLEDAANCPNCGRRVQCHFCNQLAIGIHFGRGWCGRHELEAIEAADKDLPPRPH